MTGKPYPFLSKEAKDSQCTNFVFEDLKRGKLQLIVCAKDEA